MVLKQDAKFQGARIGTKAGLREIGRRHEQIQIAVVVDVTQRGRAIRFHVGKPEWALVLKIETAPRTQVLVELGAVLMGRGVGKVAHKQIHLPIVIEIAPG